MPVRERTSETVSPDAEWEAIRRRLNDYMERERIGVGTLAKLIVERPAAPRLTSAKGAASPACRQRARR